MAATLVYANKAFGFAPDYTLWEISWQLLNAMFNELYYQNEQVSREISQSGKKGKETGMSELMAIPGVQIKEN